MVAKSWGFKMPRKFIASYESRIVRDLLCEKLIETQTITFHVQHPMLLRERELPIYIDKQQLLLHPEDWRDVVDATILSIDAACLNIDFVAATASSSAMLSQAVAYRLGLPALVIAERTDIEKDLRIANVVKGKTVLLIEDNIFTGASTLKATQSLRRLGAQISDVVALTSYELPEVSVALSDANLTLHQVIALSDVVERAFRNGRITEEVRNGAIAWAKYE